MMLDDTDKFYQESIPLKVLRQLNTNFRRLLVRDIIVLRFLLEDNEEYPNKTYEEIIFKSILSRSSVERAIKKLKRLSWVEIKKSCPNCNKEYENHIPPFCASCKREIFCNYRSVRKNSELPVYVIRIIKEKLPFIQKNLNLISKLSWII